MGLAILAAFPVRAAIGGSDWWRAFAAWWIEQDAATLVIHEPAFPFGSLDLSQDVAKRIRDAQFVVVGDHSIATSP